MPHRRPRLTYANVTSTLALFVALGGTALAAGYVVNTNGDIAPNTVSGASAPSGAHANIMADSIPGADVLESSPAKLPSAAVADRATRTGVTLNWETATDGDSRVRAKVGGLTIKATCYFDTDYTPGRLWLYA